MSFADTASQNRLSYNTRTPSGHNGLGLARNNESKDESDNEEVLLQYRKPRNKDKLNSKFGRKSNDSYRGNERVYSDQEGNDHPEDGTLGHTFLNSVFSAAQNAANSISALAANTQTHARSVSSDFGLLKAPGLFSPLLSPTTADDTVESSRSNELDSPSSIPPTIPKLQSPQPTHSRNLDVNAASLDALTPTKSAIDTLGKGELSLASLGLTPETPASLPIDSNEKLNEDNMDRSHKRSLTAKSNASRNSVSVNSVAKEAIADSDTASVSRLRSKRRSRASSFLKPEQNGDISEQSSSNFTSLQLSTPDAPSGQDINEKIPRTIVHRSGSLVKSLKERSHTRASSEIGRVPSLLSPTKTSYKQDGSVSSSESKPVLRGDKEIETNSNHKEENLKISTVGRAGEKRNNDFHLLFKSVPEDDYLLDDYSCALSREILLQGRLYVSQKHLCFQANILGWVTNLILEFEEIVAIEKRSTAGLFPNGIMVQTLHDRHIFASFIQRDITYNFLVSAWKASTEDPLHGVRRGSPYNHDSEDISDSDSADDSKGLGSTRNRYAKIKFSRKRRSRKHSQDDETDFGDDISDDIDDSGYSDDSGADLNEKPFNRSKLKRENADIDGKDSGAGSYVIPVLGPLKHAPTSTGYDPEDENEKILCRETFKAPLGVVSGLLFGNDSSFYKIFLSDIEKNTDVPEIPTFENSKREFTYVKPLNGPIGPKQTRCICLEEIEHWNYEDYVSILSTVQSPDVPSGNSFTVKTRFQLTWDENNTTKLVLSCWIDWTAKSWIKGAIEKGTYDGQATFTKDLVKWLNDTIKEGPKSAVTGEAKKKKISKKDRKARKVDLEANKKATGSIDYKTKSTSGTSSLPFVNVPVIGPVISFLAGLSSIWVIFITFVLSFILFRLTLLSSSSPNYPTGLQNLFGNKVGHLIGSYPGAGKGESANLKKFEEIRYGEEYRLWNWINNRIILEDEELQNIVDENDSKTSIKNRLEKQEMLESINLAELNLNQLRDYVLNGEVL